MYIPKEQVNELLRNVDIVDIIRNYIPLSKKGNNYVGMCPFHDDHSPSLSVNQQRQIFKCFACGEGGNAITFVQNYENISFPEAVKKTAELGGYHLDIHEEERQVDPYKERMKKLCPFVKMCKLRRKFAKRISSCCLYHFFHILYTSITLLFIKNLPTH